MNEEQLKSAEQEYQCWSDSELLRATSVDKQDYEQWALALMAQELSRRGIPLSDRKVGDLDNPPKNKSERTRFEASVASFGFFLLIALCGVGIIALVSLYFLGHFLFD